MLIAAGVAAFQSPMFRSRTAEARHSLGVIASLQLQRFIETGSYLACPPHPAEVPRGGTAPWTSAGAWARLGFRASGENRFQYEVLTGSRPRGDAEEPFFLVRARGDVDGDGVTSLYELDSHDMRRIRIENEDE